MNAKATYQARITLLNEKLSKLQVRRKLLGTTRLLLFLLAFILFFVLLGWSGLYAGISFGALIIGFLITTSIDVNNQQRLQFTTLLLKINREELKALNGDLSPFEDGERFKNPEHPYTNDLDIFGKFSLFQLINRTTTADSAELLAKWLQQPSTKDEILSRQQAVKELSKEVEWRQEFEAEGRNHAIKKSDFRQVSEWSRREMSQKEVRKWSFIVPVVLLTTAAFVLLASLHIVSWNILWLALILHSWGIWRLGKIIGPWYHLLSKTAPALAAFEKKQTLITTHTFESERLKALQKKSWVGERPAFELISRLKKILARLDIRFNPLVHFPLNLIFFWDFFQYRQLVRWHQATHSHLRQWMDVVAEVEVLSCLANLAFNHANWCFPEINLDYFSLEAKDIGHPLIPEEKRIDNDLALTGKGKMMLVTGSNMAGKSTFLRSVGVNVTLALAGAPVCASSMKVSRVHVISSMRIADNLEDSISTFYAELKKLEYVIDQSKEGNRILLLLDEILRGTNSADRHQGSKALIKQLIHDQSVGILATHDLALTNMEQDFPQNILNYHFDVQVKGEDLFFDYKLKSGICTSMNASILMKKIGIEM